MRKLLRIGIYAMFAGAFLRCGGGPTEVVQGGGGSEAVALTGLVRHPNGSPAVQARVRLRPRLYLTDTARISDTSKAGAETLTDSAGRFRLDSLERGEYELEVRDTQGIAVRGAVAPLKGSGGAVRARCILTGENPVVGLAALTLGPTGTVTGGFLAPAGFTERIYVQIYGLDRVVRTDSLTGRFRLEGLPKGTYTLRAVYPSSFVDAREVAGVEVGPDDTTDIGARKLASFESEDYAEWPHARKLFLNTGKTGADVQGNAADFPLLVRLHKGNFDFTQSRGVDVRFSDAKGKRLRYQVERWDSAAGAAEIWVRLDMVSGNSESQFLAMHWGKADAPDWSDGREVFGAETGFAGVWHLDEEAADTISENLYQDAVGLNPADDRASSPGRAGVIGYGRHFDGNDYLLVPAADPVLQPSGKVAVSTWVKVERTGPYGGNLLSMGDNYNLRVNSDGNLHFSLYDGRIRFVRTTGVDLRDAAWHHVAGYYDGYSLGLYVDGELAATIPATGPIVYNFYPRFVMGRHGNRQAGFDFTGSLDETTVSTEIRSAHWIKLAYENQKAGSALLVFRP
jgi:hypothetical protein